MFLAKLKPKIRKLCVVRIYINIDEIIVATIKIEQVLGELEETPYEPMREEQDEMAYGKSAADR
jgi:hypothetical protein